jgi:glycosyltransferase involved in cell wall biosynthesis
MKILHIIDSGGLYGAEVMLLNLMDEQIKQGLDPTIASIGEKGIHEKQLETEALKRGFKVKKFRMRPGPNYMGAMEILKFAHQEGFHILHSHGYKGNILFGLLPRKIRKIPMVSTLHGWTSTNGFSKMRLYEWLDRKSLKHIDSVVLVSNAMKSHPKLKNLKGINFHVIPNGIPIPEKRVDESTPQQFNQTPIQFNKSTISQFNNLTNQQFDKGILDFCSNGFTIGSIGRLSKEKGYKYLIEALSILIKKDIDARLIIIGEGDERDYLEGIVSQFQLTNRVLMPGYRKDAKQYLSYFNVFVISSLTEGLPISLLEAMQASVPVVATDVGGIPAILNNGEAGLMVKPRNPLSISEAIGSLYYHEKLSDKLTAAAYRRVTTCYSSKTMALEYLNVYNRLI